MIGGPSDPMTKPTVAWLWGNGGCLPRTVSIGFLISLTVFLTLYYMATEDPTRYLTLPATISQRMLFYDPVDVVAQRYLVDGPRCRIPNVDPYDKEVRRFIHTISHIPCSKLDPLTYVTKTKEKNGTTTITLVVDEHLISSYSRLGINCCYSTIKRAHDDKKPDDAITISKCEEFKNSVNISEPFVLVKCVTRNRKKEVYKNAHAVVNISPSIQQKIDDNNLNNESKPLNVLLIGIDSISRLNSIRTMPRTLKYLDVNGWIELKGYNKIGDNTFPNLMALLTGLEGDATYNLCLPTKLYRLENCSFIWTKYRDNGYITAYAEDAAAISTFNYHKLGFVHEPTDYYFRPFMKAAEKELKSVEKYSMKYCVGPVSAGERILTYATDFASTFANTPNFGLFWMNTFSHNDLNMPSSMDNTMLKFFEELNDRNVNENAIIVFFSDHGIRFGKIRDTKIGWLEERLPFIYISVPRWFQEKFPQEYRNLQINANRLTTPYDLHMTLQHILVLAGKINSVTPSAGCPKCQSLFDEINNNRSCEDAAISPHWCMCNSYKNVPIDNSTVKQAANYVLHRIQEYVDMAGSNISKNCAKLSLNRIMKAEIGESWYTNETYFLMSIETTPGLGKFEATLSYIKPKHTDTSIDKLFKLHSSISRLDTYADQSYCVNDATLKKYCYCR